MEYTPLGGVYTSTLEGGAHPYLDQSAEPPSPIPSIGCVAGARGGGGGGRAPGAPTLQEILHLLPRPGGEVGA